MLATYKNTQWLLFIVILLTVLLFIKYPATENNVLFKQFWESGHFFLFAGLVILLSRIKQIQKESFGRLLIATILLCFLLGYITESIQFNVGRNFEDKDIFFDILGGLTGLLIVFLFRKISITKKALLFLGIVLNVSLGIHLVVFAAINQWNIQKQFPLLSDFETSFEKYRWQSTNADIAISEKYQRQGKKSLRVDYYPGRYPRVFLNHFRKDWTNYQWLNFSLYNPTEQTIELTMVIYDSQHQHHGFGYYDRFNRELTLQSGWNDYSILLDEVKNAPKERTIAMDDILVLGFWMKQLEENKSIYLDFFYLN